MNPGRATVDAWYLATLWRVAWPILAARYLLMHAELGTGSYPEAFWS